MSETVTVFGVQVRVEDALLCQWPVRAGVELDLYGPIDGQWGAGIALEIDGTWVCFLSYEQGAQASVDAAERDCRRWLADRSTDCQSTV